MKYLLTFIIFLSTILQGQLTIPTYASETDGFRLLGAGNDSLGLNPEYWMRYNSSIWDLEDDIISVNFQNTEYPWGVDEVNESIIAENDSISRLLNDSGFTNDAPDDNFISLGGIGAIVMENDSLLIWDYSTDTYKKAAINEVVASEYVQDIIGTPLTSGLQTRITVNYDDNNGEYDFVVEDMYDNTDTQNDSTAIDGYGFIPDAEFATHKSSNDHDGRYYTETEIDNIALTLVLKTAVGDTILEYIDDTVYNATSWDANTDAATKNAIRDKIETLGGGHDEVTLNANATAGGLSLSTQEINYRAATNSQTGYMTTAFVANIETNNAKETNTDAQKIDVFSISGNNVQLSVENDGEATKTVDISTITAVAANSAKTGVTDEISDIVEDTTPQLGGNLDIQAHSIEGVDATEFGYLDGVSSDIQTQFGTKQGLDATLTAFAGLTIGANELIYGTGADAFSMLGVNATATNKFLRQVSSGVPAWATLATGDIPDISATYQPLDGALTNISGLAYVSPSFLKMTANDTYAVRTLAEALSDLSGVASGAFDWNSQSFTGINDVGATTGTFSSTITTNSNYVVEGYSTGRNIMRSIQLQIPVGATPGTNINIVNASVIEDLFNPPTITNATNLAVSGTDGSFSLSADGKNITLDLTEVAVGILNISVVLLDVENSTSTVSYYARANIVGSNIIFYLHKSGTTPKVSWLSALTSAGDRIYIQCLFITST